MKTTIIENLYDSQISSLAIELFEFVEMTYGISEAEDKFLAYFVNVLKKQYKHLTFENLEDAFYRNSCGLLDNYLAKVGFRADNKVLKFSIPDLTKIINAYCKFVGIEKNDTGGEKKEFSQEEKNKIRQKWCDTLCEIFDKYLQDKKRSPIRVPMYTAKVLSRIGVLDFQKIDFSEPPTNIMTSRTRSNNENAIYECFDDLILQEKHIDDHLKGFRNEFDCGMPY